MKTTKTLTPQEETAYSTFQEVLHISKSTREKYRNISTADPQKYVDIQKVLWRVRDEWPDEFRLYLQRNRVLAPYNDPIKILSRERRAELSRLYSAMCTTSRPTPQIKRSQNLTALRVEAQAYEYALRAARKQYKVLLKTLGFGRLARTPAGAYYWSMQELNDECALLLEGLSRKGRDLSKTLRNYDGPKQATAERYVLKARELAQDVRREINVGAKTTTPLRFEDERWTTGRVRRALIRFHAAHGRYPTAKELNTIKELPSYPTVRARLGPQPLTTLEAEL